jgi:RluA family pseudouridine synthase
MSQILLEPAQVLLLDAHLCVLNKPRGVPTQGRPGLGGDSLYSAALRLPAVERLWMVHSLDRVTSGVVVFARSAEAAAALSGQFRDRLARKTYLAWVHGQPPAASGVIDLPLTREGGRPRVDLEHGKPARTRYRVLRRWPPEAQDPSEATLLYLRPYTGRTHQLRVHLAAIGCPILGDPIHGGARDQGLGCRLHALELRLRHPADGRPLRLRAPPRDGFCVQTPYT